MNKEIIVTNDAPPAVGPYSQAVKAGEFIFCAGQIPLTSQGELVVGDIKAQTRQCLINLQAVLEAAGSSLNQVVKTTVYLSNMENFFEFNQAYAEFFAVDPPARAIVESPRLPKGAEVEIECVAVV